MATLEEKQELVDALSGPRYYRIMINGYGGESAYMSISKAAHDFWQSICEEHGDNDLVEYMLCEELDECDFDNIETVPQSAQFLHDVDDENYKRPWYESHTEFDHTHGVEYGSAYVDIDEVSSDDYSADAVCEIYSRTSISDLNDQLSEETDWEVELVEMGCCEEPECEYIAQMYSSEKGTFFEGIIETVGDFDPKKLKFYTTEYLNGEDIITEVEYDGESVENFGGDTNGKGYYAAVWVN